MLNVFTLFRKPLYKCFEDEVDGRKLKSRSYKGTKAINVNQIVGSVGRCKRDHTISIDKDSDRYKRVKKALNDMNCLPAIQVYDLDHEYYIVDGHHRVEASKELGMEFLDAEIIEFKYH